MDIPQTAAAPLPGFRLYVVTDRRICGGVEGLTERLVRTAEGLPVGTMAIEVREKDLAASALLEMVCRLREALAPWRVPVLVNDRWDVAHAADADGVHLPESGLAPATVRRAWPTAHIGCSTHSAEALAALRGADFATFGPVFATPSKLAYGPPQGIERLRSAVATSPVPVFAIGGIDADTARQLRDTGIAGIAVIRAVLSATDPASAARTLLEEAGLLHREQEMCGGPSGRAGAGP